LAFRQAKQNGQFDLGIKTFSGREVMWSSEPRAFHFQGLDGIHETLYVLKVKVDSGITRDVALSLYEEGKSNTILPNTNHSGWAKRCKSGFYIDSRSYLKKGPTPLGKKVFLFIFGDHTTNKVLQVRPNSGRMMMSKIVVLNKIHNYDLCDTEEKIGSALELWAEEFNRSDISNKKNYQFSCNGRHKETTVMIGSMVPILNKVLIGLQSEYDDSPKMLDIVRIETGVNHNLNTNRGIVVDDDIKAKQSTPQLNKCKSTLTVDLTKNPLLTGYDNIGEGLAVQFDQNGIIRGYIAKYKDNDTFPDECPSGTFYCKFTNGRKKKMGAKQLKEAR